MSETRAVQRKADQLPAPIVSLVQQLVPDCGRLLPPDMSLEQFRGALWLELTGRPALHDCTPQSLRECVVKAAMFGLLPGRDCHFLPFGSRRGGAKLATYVPNYQGILLMLERSGKVRRAFAHPVHDGDAWEYDYFSDRPVHKPAQTIGHKQGPELFYYGAIQFTDGSFAVEIVTLDALDKIRRTSPAHESGPWMDWPEMMKRKTALKRVAKYVRLTPQLAAVLEEDETRLLEDIPPERHTANVVALFGEPHGSPFAHQEPREATQNQRETADSSLTPSPGGESIVGQSDAKQRVSSPQRETSSWRTLEAHVADADVPEALRTAAEMLLEDADATEQQAFGVAGRILDSLDGKREAPDEAQTEIF